MTWITSDGRGTIWVDATAQRKRRKSPRALRFAEIKVGDHLMKRWADPFNSAAAVWYYIVTDLWFDPVAGQDDPISGQMVAIRLFDPRTGEERAHKESHTIRGLASQGFHYADIDFPAHVKAYQEAEGAGVVVGIGKAHVIRRRPKVPGERF